MFSSLRRRIQSWSSFTKFSVALILLLSFLCITGFSIFYLVKEFWQGSLSTDSKSPKLGYSFPAHQPNNNSNNNNNNHNHNVDNSHSIKAINGGDNAEIVKKDQDNHKKNKKSLKKRSVREENGNDGDPSSLKKSKSNPKEKRNHSKNHKKKKPCEDSSTNDSSHFHEHKYVHDHIETSEELESLLAALEPSEEEALSNVSSKPRSTKKRLKKRQYSSSTDDSNSSAGKNKNKNKGKDKSKDKSDNHSKSNDNSQDINKKRKKKHADGYDSDCSDCELKVELVKGMSKERRKSYLKRHEKTASIYDSFKKRKRFAHKKERERETKKEKNKRKKRDSSPNRTEFLKNLLLERRNHDNNPDENDNKDESAIFDEFSDPDVNDNTPHILSPVPQRYKSTGPAGKYPLYIDYVNSLSAKAKKKGYSYLPPYEMFESDMKNHGRKRPTAKFLTELEAKRKRRMLNYRKWLKQERGRRRNILNSKPRPFVPEEEGLSEIEPTREIVTNLDDKIKNALDEYFTNLSKKKQEMKKAFIDSDDERDPPIRKKDIKILELLKSAISSSSNVTAAAIDQIINPKAKILQNMTDSEILHFDKSRELSEKAEREKKSQSLNNGQLTFTPQVTEKITTDTEKEAITTQIHLKKKAPESSQSPIANGDQLRETLKVEKERDKSNVNHLKSNAASLNSKNTNNGTIMIPNEKKENGKGNNKDQDYSEDTEADAFSISSNDENINRNPPNPLGTEPESIKTTATTTSSKKNKRERHERKKKKVKFSKKKNKDKNRGNSKSKSKKIDDNDNDDSSSSESTSFFRDFKDKNV